MPTNEINQTLNRYRGLIDTGILLSLITIAFTTGSWKSEMEEQHTAFQGAIQRNADTINQLRIATETDARSLREEIRTDLRRVEAKLDRLIERSTK